MPRFCSTRKQNIIPTLRHSDGDEQSTSPNCTTNILSMVDMSLHLRFLFVPADCKWQNCIITANTRMVLGYCEEVLANCHVSTSSQSHLSGWERSNYSILIHAEGTSSCCGSVSVAWTPNNANPNQNEGLEFNLGACTIRRLHV